MNTLNYPYKPIGSIRALALALGTSEENLFHLTQDSDSHYYVVRTEIRPDGSTKLTYDVKPKLKHIHEKISVTLLQKMEYPEYLQGSLKGKCYLSNTRKHTNQKFLICEDATKFFPSISKVIISQIWCSFFNFPHEVADYLSELTTFKGSMVQGCKTSSFLANLALWEREFKLVTSLKKRHLTYTRYVDDITISSSRNISKKEQTKIISDVYSLLRSIGASPNRKKHDTMGNGKRQSVHRVNVNRATPSFNKQVRGNIRAAVFNCEKMFLNGSNTHEYRKLYNSAKGRVCMLTRLHPLEGKKLKSKLQLIKPVRA